MELSGIEAEPHTSIYPDIPPELLLQILRNLNSVDDITSASVVSRVFRDCSHHNLWKSVCWITRRDTQLDPGTFFRTTAFGLHTHTLDLGVSLPNLATNINTLFPNVLRLAVDVPACNIFELNNNQIVSLTLRLHPMTGDPGTEALVQSINKLTEQSNEEAAAEDLLILKQGLHLALVLDGIANDRALNDRFRYETTSTPNQTVRHVDYRRTWQFLLPRILGKLQLGTFTAPTIEARMDRYSLGECFFNAEMTVETLVHRLHQYQGKEAHLAAFPLSERLSQSWSATKLAILGIDDVMDSSQLWQIKQSIHVYKFDDQQSLHLKELTIPTLIMISGYDAEIHDLVPKGVKTLQLHCCRASLDAGNEEFLKDLDRKLRKMVDAKVYHLRELERIIAWLPLTEDGKMVAAKEQLTLEELRESLEVVTGMLEAFQVKLEICTASRFADTPLGDEDAVVAGMGSSRRKAIEEQSQRSARR